MTSVDDLSSPATVRYVRRGRVDIGWEVSEYQGGGSAGRRHSTRGRAIEEAKSIVAAAGGGIVRVLDGRGKLQFTSTVKAAAHAEPVQT